MLMGIVHGVIDTEGLTEVETCLQDGKYEATRVGEAFQDYWHGEWLTGTQELLDALLRFSTLAYDCSHMQEDIATLESWVTGVLAEADFVGMVRHNVTHNLLKLTRDLNKAKNEWAAETYWDFGNTVGEMLTIVTQPVLAIE